ncbi:MAG: hypothetical protein L6R35_006570 [Caloplaca aegaea]|nr:MAG: hypothetical protein L6R35_006570 [Caloplaca aegaea]
MSLFPVFFLPPIPFCRRKLPSSFDTIKSDSYAHDHVTSTKDGYLVGHISHLRCARCATDLCPTSQIISKGFTGRHGRAYLVSASPITDPPQSEGRSRYAKGASLPNTNTHKAVPRQLVTGAHTVCDVSCAFCGSVIGWKYDSAEEETQRYKVGKYILESKKTIASSCWEGCDNEKGGAAIDRSRGSDRQPWEASVEFDSQDEDECEDLFAGVWSPAVAIRRRQGKRFDRTVCEHHSKPQLVQDAGTPNF